MTDVPERQARATIDATLTKVGWVVQDRDEINLGAARGVAVREYKMADGFVDYLLFVDEHPVGVIEAKQSGHTLDGVFAQAAGYSAGLPEVLDAPVRPLPFVYVSTGVETKFMNLLDPECSPREIFAFHRPETLSDWIRQQPLSEWIEGWRTPKELRDRKLNLDQPTTLRSRLRAMPDVDIANLWENKKEALTRLERSLYQNRPRALIQMATGSGKTLLAITAVYRLIKFAGARRVLFLVDRANLGEQAEKEFQSYVTPDTRKRFTELYNVQRLTSNTVADSAKVAISTIQRLYSMLSGQELDPEVEEHSQYDPLTEQPGEPVTVAYNAAIPIEFFDVVVIDECHRSIYSLWRQVVEYFDAFLIGLTATPAKHTYAFFHQNVVMEYGYEQAVADGVNVDHDVYRIRTKITTQGSTIEASPDTVVGHRDRQTRSVRWAKTDEPITYAPDDLDLSVVATDQIRTIVRAFKERCLPEMFPDRKEVPKTLIFAKDDSHAEDIVAIVRDVFGRGYEFAQKITYKTTGADPHQLIQDFRTGYFPRVAVTVDMIATGTDIRPIEIVMFMRTVKSRILFEQMKGRGVRIIDPNELRAVTPDATSKDRFVIVDCVGVYDQEKVDTRPLDRDKTVSLKALLEHVASGGTNEDYISSLAVRLRRLDQRCEAIDRQAVRNLSGGSSLEDLAHGILRVLSPEIQEAAAREQFTIPEGQDVTQQQLDQAADRLVKEAVRPLATNPKLRRHILDLKAKFEQILDTISLDELTEAGAPDVQEKARVLVQNFEEYVKEHRDEIDALQFFYSQPHRRRLRYKDIKDLADVIKAPPLQWTPEKLWAAYETLKKDKVRARSPERLLTDMVSLVRFALHKDDELKPYAEQVRERFQNWLAQQANQGRRFTDQQVRWLEMMRDHIATSLDISVDDLDYTPFVAEGGLGKAQQVFGGQLGKVMKELNEALAA